MLSVSPIMENSRKEVDRNKTTEENWREIEDTVENAANQPLREAFKK